MFERCKVGKVFFIMNEQLRLYLSEVFPGISHPYEGKTVLTIEKQVVYPWDVEGSS